MALPFCFKESGLVVATLLMMVGCVAAFYSIHLLALVSDITEQRTYEELVEHIFGTTVGVILNLSIIIFTYGSTVAYMIVIGDTIPPLTALVGLEQDAFYTQRWFLMLASTIVLIYPLALLKHLSSLRFTAILGFLASIYLILAMFGRAVEVMESEGGGFDKLGIKLWNPGYGFFLAAPVVFYAFSSHVNIFSIYRELTRPSLMRLDLVIFGNVILALLVYGGIGAVGYLTFGDKTEENVIKNYDPHDVPIQVGSFLLTMAVILNIPLNTHPLRVTLDWMMFGPSSRIGPNLRYYVEITVLVFSALAIAIFVPSITLVFQLVGATATSLCCYIMPGLLHLKVSRLPLWHYKALPSVALVLMGSGIGVVSTFFTALDVIK